MAVASSSVRLAMPPRDALPRTITMGRAGISRVARMTCSVKLQTTAPASLSPSRTTALASRLELPFGVLPQKGVARCTCTNIRLPRVHGKSCMKRRAPVALAWEIMQACKSLEVPWYCPAMDTHLLPPARFRIGLTVKCMSTLASNLWAQVGAIP